MLVLSDPVQIFVTSIGESGELVEESTYLAPLARRIPQKGEAVCARLNAGLRSRILIAASDEVAPRTGDIRESDDGHLR
jgi:hypothetical protein